MQLEPIRQDATIGVFSPAKELDKFSVFDVLEKFKSTNFRFVFDRSIISPLDDVLGQPISSQMLKSGQRYLSPQEKADSFHRLIEDENVDIIWAFDGPDGSIDTVHCIDWELVRKNPKPVIGFSDVTAFLNALTAKTGVPTFCTENLSSVDTGGLNFQMLQKLLQGQSFSLTSEFVSCQYGRTYDYQRKRIVDLPPMVSKHYGQASGHLVGGNLTRLRELQESGITPEYEDAILFLEDTGETIEAIGEHIKFLELEGVFAQVSALMLGDFNNISAKKLYEGLSLEEVFNGLIDSLAKQNKPCVTGLPTGHMRLSSQVGQPSLPRRLFPLPIGTKVALSSSKISVCLNLNLMS